MPLSKNRVIIACAGSGKTTQLVEEALAHQDRRILIVTYTISNTREIINKFGELNSGVPKHVDVMTWYGFLLRECARPYQRSMYTDKRIESIQFKQKQSARYSSETDIKRHYFMRGEFIYSDKIAKFVVKCNEVSGQLVTSRLGQVYTDIFIDEFQDLAGWDLDVIEMLMQSEISITMVGDPRQHTYATNNAPKNKQHLGANVLNLVEKWRKKRLCKVESRDKTYRCNSAICEFANRLWPGLPPMESLQSNETGHDGIFLVGEDVVPEYIKCFKPQILRYDKRTKNYGFDAMNFGVAKGRQFKRVLVVPTKGIKKYLQNGDIKEVKKSKDKFYVAITRAMHSVAFVYNDSSAIVPNRWQLT